MNKLIYGVSDWIFMLVLLTFIFTVSIFLVINASWLYLIVAVTLNLSGKYGVPLHELSANFLKIIDYLQNPFIGKLKLTGFTMSANGVQHFSDVRGLVLMSNSLMIMSGVAITVFLLKYGYAKKLWKFENILKMIIFSVVIVAGLCLVDFNDIFIYFHRLLFRNQDWVFNPKYDSIINVLPDQYFLVCFLLFFALFTLGLMTIYLFGRRQLKKDL